MRTMNRAQQQAYDRRVPERTGLPSLLLMEHAGLALCQACERVLATCEKAGLVAGGHNLLSPEGCRELLCQPVTILVGKGNNGGDGYVLARLLAAAGRSVRLLTWGQTEPGEVAAEPPAAEALPGQRPPALTAPTDADLNRQAALALRLPCFAMETAETGDLKGLYVDCILGTGFKKTRSLPPVLANFFQRLADARRSGLAYVIAADIPSGVEADTGLIDPAALRADETVTFVYPKPGLFVYPGRDLAGHITCADLGVPPTLGEEVCREFTNPGAAVITAALVKYLLPERVSDGHKKTFGSTLLYAGSREYIGAGLLATAAALASGAGLVTRMVEPEGRQAAATALPAAITQAKATDLKELEADFYRRQKNYQSILLGPGSGLTAETACLTRLLAEGDRVPILDADALTLLARDDRAKVCLHDRVKKGLPPAILTPHPGEFARLFPDLDPTTVGRLEAARLGAERLQCVLVLKGAGTVVACPAGQAFALTAEPALVDPAGAKAGGEAGGSSAGTAEATVTLENRLSGPAQRPARQVQAGCMLINSTGSSALAKGGSGDVLAGLIAGLAARGLSPAAAAVCGVYWHGLAGDLEASVCGPESLVADRLPDRLGEAYRQIQTGRVK